MDPKVAYAGLLDGLSGANGPNFDFWEETARRELCLLLYHLPAIMRPRETPAQATCAYSYARHALQTC